jgi:hypothetical protein
MLPGLGSRRAKTAEGIFTHGRGHPMCYHTHLELVNSILHHHDLGADLFRSKSHTPFYDGARLLYLGVPGRDSKPWKTGSCSWPLFGMLRPTSASDYDATIRVSWCRRNYLSQSLQHDGAAEVAREGDCECSGCASAAFYWTCLSGETYLQAEGKSLGLSAHRDSFLSPLSLKPADVRIHLCHANFMHCI